MTTSCSVKTRFSSAPAGAGDADDEGVLESADGTAEKADGVAENALKADEGPDLPAAANPLVEENAENGDAAARLVVGVAFVNVAEVDAGAAGSLGVACSAVEAGGTAGGIDEAAKGAAEKVDFVFGFCCSAGGLVGAETEARGEEVEVNAANGEAFEE